MSTEHLQMIIDAMRNLGVEARWGFIAYLGLWAFAKILSLVTVLASLAMGIRLIRYLVSSFCASRRLGSAFSKNNNFELWDEKELQEACDILKQRKEG